MAQDISSRELEVLAAVADHQTNAEIARRLFISVRTVESHVASLLRKLGVANRRELASRAAQVMARSAGAAGVTGMPPALTTFVGRGREVDGLGRLLAQSRLVTLVGPGGVGKTRLAIEAARSAAEDDRWPEAVFVSLVPVAPDFVVQAVAAVFGIGERPDESLAQALLQGLRTRRCLLVLDNCEHVLAAVGTLVRSVLAACPHVVVLATSRQRLDLDGERVFIVAPLSLIGDEHGSAEPEVSEAARLFADRSAPEYADGQDAELVGEICRRLEGMPLAIELAAARRDSLGLDGLLAGIDDHLRLLSRLGHADDRHRSLRSVIDWSHNLLDDDEKVLFRRLGTFRGGFDLAAAHEVAAPGTLAETGDLIGRLSDKSLLIRSDADGRSRWRMLDTIRAYAAEQLNRRAELDSARERHLNWALGEARALVSALESGSDWQESFDAVADDLRAAVAASSAGQPGYELAMVLGHLVFARRYLAEARAHLAAAVGLAPDDAAAIAALRLAAGAAFSEMRGGVAYDLLMKSHERAMAAADTRTAAIVLAEAAGLAGRAPALFVNDFEPAEVASLIRRARELGPEDDLELDAHLAIAEAWSTSSGFASSQIGPARRAVELARRSDDPRLISIALDAAAAAYAAEHRHREAAGQTAERVRLLDRLARHDPSVGGEIADIYHMATEAAIATGQLDDALAVARRQAEDAATFGLAHFAANHLVIVFALKGEFDEATEQAQVMLAGWEQAGRPAAGWMGPPYYAAALVYGLRGDRERYDSWHAHAHAVTGGGAASGFSVYSDLRVALHAGDHDMILSSSGAAKDALYSPYTAAVVAEAAVLSGAPDRAERLAAAERFAAENDFIAAHVTRVAGLLSGNQETLRRSAASWERIGARFERACTLARLADREDEGLRELSALGCPPPARAQ